MFIKNILNNHFKSHGYLAEGRLKNAKGQILDIAAMPAILRTLLVTDGTVTKTLEAYFWEPVSVVSLDQHEVKAAKSIEFLDCLQGDPLLDRQIRLVGQSTKKVYAYAHSFIRLDMLPPTICSDLKAGLIGIGEILRESGLETYRELVDLGKETSEEADKTISKSNSNESLPKDEHIIYRTYRIMINHKPVILVTERFPYSIYSSQAC